MRHFLIALPVALLLAGCGNDGDLPPLVGSGTTDDPRAEAMFQRAQEADDRGDRKRAIKLYDELADDIPYATRAPEARFRQARLLDESGETLDAFDAYQELLRSYQGSGYYERALERQAEMASAAADGEIQNSFLGLKSDLASDDVIEMLEKVIANAPRSPVAAEAAYKIGEIHAEDEKTREAVLAYRRVVEEHNSSTFAPQAQFRIGEILLKEAAAGNQDQANLDRAEEAFRDYLSQFPNHERAGEARELIANIEGRDLENTYRIGRFYEDKGNLSSARFYYQEVVRRSGSGELHDKAQSRLSALESN